LLVVNAADARTKENPVMRVRYYIRPRMLSSGTAARHRSWRPPSTSPWMVF